MSTKWVVWIGGRKSGGKKGNKNIVSTLQYLYLHTRPRAHTHTHTLYKHTENFAEVLKSPQCALFICFLFPCYVIAATTVAIAGGGTGSASTITQSCGHSRCTGSRSLCGVTCVLLWLWTIVRVLRSPRGPAGPAHGMDLCEQTSAGLVFCIVL